MEQAYPLLRKVQRMLDVFNQANTEAARQGDPQLLFIIAREGPEPQIQMRYIGQGELENQVDLAEELGLSSGETIQSFRWAEAEGYIRPNYDSGGREAHTAIASLDHLDSKGYEMIGELPNPQERLALILDAAIQAVERDTSLGPQEKKKRIDWFEEAKFVIRTFGVEVAKAVWRGDLPPM
jgi:hypothetical protein